MRMRYETGENGMIGKNGNGSRGNGESLKRRAGILLAAALCFTAPQVAMGAVWKADDAGQEERGYEFVYGETRIVLAEDASAALSALGEADSVFEQDSCAYQGKDRVYSYSDFELSTYPSGKEERIASVYFLNDKVQTEEGIKIGSAYDDMVKAYGRNYTEENEVYRYVRQGTELSFYMKNGKIDAVEYLAVPADGQGSDGRNGAAEGK